jgi:hypothetical protein
MINFYEFSEILKKSSDSESDVQYHKPAFSDLDNDSQLNQHYTGSDQKHFNEILQKGQKLGDWMGSSYFFYDGKIYELKNNKAQYRGSVLEFEKSANQDLVKRLGISELLKGIQGKKFPPEIEKERQIRLSIGSSTDKEEARVWDLMDQAIKKAGIEAQVDKLRNQEENLIFYGKYMDMTLFTHRNGPYSDIIRVKGVVKPESFDNDRYEGYSPRGFEIEIGKTRLDFHPTDIAQIHDVDIETTLGDIENDVRDYDDYLNSIPYPWQA